MPSPPILIARLAEAAGAYTWLAIAWHVVLVAAVVAVIAGWRPARDHGARWLALPAASVAAVAAATGNPFNAISFIALALLLVVLAPRPMPTHRPRWMRVLAIALVAFGALYPHFVPGSLARVLYAAPLGVLPCPTLAVLAGAALLAGSRAQALALACWTACYAAIGVLWLGVALDLGLDAAAFGLVLLGLEQHLGVPAAPAAR